MCSMIKAWEAARRLALVRRVLQKFAISSAEARPPTCLLQKASNASFRALWNSELPLKHSFTYCMTAGASQYSHLQSWLSQDRSL